MINSTINTIEGLIEEIDNYLNDLHIEEPKNYKIAEQQKKILERTLEQLNDL